MAEIVNLNRTRKRKARETREQTAAEQRLKFGRTRVERKSVEAAERIKTRTLDGHKLVREDEI